MGVVTIVASDEPLVEPTETPAQEVHAEKGEPEETIRLEDVRTVLAAKSRDGYGAQVRELITKHGGSKLSDIDPSEYGAVLKEAEVFGHAT